LGSFFTWVLVASGCSLAVGIVSSTKAREQISDHEYAAAGLRQSGVHPERIIWGGVGMR
jgi:hypothetical protein